MSANRNFRAKETAVIRLPLRTPLLQAALLALTLSGVGTGCNLYSFMDQPGSSEQYLSRARACLDKGDYACARENYAKVSGDALDNAKSEEAFAILAQEGIEIGDFYSALTATSDSGGSGASINALANHIATLSPGEAKRKALFQAFQLAASISNGSTELRGLTRLVTSMSLMAELLAETAGNDGLDSSDYINDPAACASATCGSFSTAADGCDPSVFTQSSAISLTDWSSDTPETAIDGSVPTMDMIRLSLNQINVASSELGQGGSTENTGEFAGSFDSLPTGNGASIYDRCFMQTLLNQGIGQ